MASLNDLLLRESEEFNIPQPTGNIGAMQFTSKFLDDLQQYGIEIHYELHYSEGSRYNLMRICCHAYPYHKFSNGAHNTKEQYLAALNDKYGNEKVQKILSFREAMRKDYLQFGRTYEGELDYHKKNDIDYLDLVCKRLERVLTGEELTREIYCFIGETYHNLISTINDNIGLLK